MKERKKKRDIDRGKISLIGERGKNSERALNKTHARVVHTELHKYSISFSSEGERREIDLTLKQ